MMQYVIYLKDQCQYKCAFIISQAKTQCSLYRVFKKEGTSQKIIYFWFQNRQIIMQHVIKQL